MLVLKPYYYDQFQCIAGNCTNSCCIGWHVFVDKKSFKSYRQKTGALRGKLNNHVHKRKKHLSNSSYAYIEMQEDGRCSFLGEDNLCDIYKAYGEKALCATCTTYPRVIREYKGIYERNLLISCPVVAKYLVDSKEPFYFVTSEEELTSTDTLYLSQNEKDRDLEAILWDVRSMLIEIAQFREIPVWKRLILILQITDKVQSHLMQGSYKEEILEHLKIYWQNKRTAEVLDQLSNHVGARYSLVQEWIDLRITYGLQDKKLESYMKLTKELIQNHNPDESLDTLECVFNQCLENRNHLLENYIVYTLYGTFMEGLGPRNIRQEVMYLVLNYTVLKTMLMATWFAKNKQLEDEDIIDILSVLGRSMEHYGGLKKEIITSMEKVSDDVLAYLMQIVR